ncbi:MAG: aminopeptidase [archaeon]|jgi:leucyl aminopeptidase (aminopeptidase T)
MSLVDKFPDCLKVISKVMQKQDIAFCVIGSSSLFFQGLNIIPHDIDLVVPKNDLVKITKSLKKYCVIPITPHENEISSYYNAVFKINGVEVEILEDYKVKIDGKISPVGQRALDEKNFVEYNGVQLMCSSLRSELSKYKSFNRDKDKQKIKLIEAKLNENKPVVSEGLSKTAGMILFDFLEVRKNSKVLLINDHTPNPVLEAFKSILDKEKIPFAESKLREDRVSSEPIPEILSQMVKSKIIIAPTTKSITWSPETKIAADKGAKIITLPSITEEIFLKIGEANFDEIWKENNKIAKQLRGKNKVQVTTPSGTNISFSIKKRELHGLKPKKGGFVMNLPTGEVYCAPIEETMDGEIFIDYFKELIKPEDKAWLKVENGRISEWNPSAQPFIDAQRAENGLIVAEFGIGTNKWHKGPIGNILHDEKIFGTVHIAFGNNVSFGGKNKSPVHNDLILIKPNVLIDGKKLEW